MTKYCYIHIPFCDNICSYCDFCKMFYNEKLVDKYLDSLEKEINSIYKNEVLETIYIGGGTPSSLNINQLNRLFNILDKLNKSNNVEYTIECNFSNITKEKLDLFKEKGINRISFGIETINEKYFDFLERHEDINKIKEIINYSKSINLNNINVDLMYAFTNETLNEVNKDIDFILDLNINHISTYSLIIEENTKLFINKVKNIDEEIDSDMYDLICKKLKENNFNHYEISNFSKEGYESKHNLCYWNNDNYYGFGLGASSYIDNKRISNTRSINKYLEENYKLSEEILSKKDIIEYEIILGFRKSIGINLIKFKNKYGTDLNNYYKYDKLLKDDLLKISNNNLFIPEDKWYLSNSIIVNLLEGEVK